MNQERQEAKPTIQEALAAGEYWNNGYRPPSLGVEQLSTSFGELIAELSQAATRRGFKPVLACTPEDLAYVLLFEDDIDANAQEDIYGRISSLRRQQGIDPRDREGANRFYRSVLPAIFCEAVESGVKLFSGVTVSDDLFDRKAYDLGITVEEFIKIFGLEGYRGIVVADSAIDPATGLHEYTHVRDYSIYPFPFIMYRPASAAYELLTGMRTVAIAPGLRYSLGHSFRAYLDSADPRTDMRSALDGLRKNERHLRRLSRILSEVTRYPEDKTRVALEGTLDYVVECESNNPPIAHEVPPEVLNIWT